MDMLNGELTSIVTQLRMAKPGEVFLVRNKEIYDYIVNHNLNKQIGKPDVTIDIQYRQAVPQLSGNPKDLVGSTKVPLNLVPAALIAETSLAFLEGKLKYGEVNWRAAPVRVSVYLDAAFRHLAKYAEGEDRDSKSCVHHLGNATACFGIIIDAALAGTLIDDRKMSNPKAIEQMDELSDTVKHLQELFKDSKPKHFTKENANEVSHTSHHPV